MSNGERHTPENMTEKGMPTASLPTAGASARTEARVKELEVTTNGLSRDVSVLQEKMKHLATREDIAEVRAEIAEVRAEIAEVRAENRESVAELKAEIAQVRAENRESVAELKAEIAEMRAENRENISQLESRMWRAIGIQTGIILTPILIALANKLI